ncbi:MAG TPA: formyltransferase family protein [Thermoanaerobaculia bacterium]|nr:formyltransferase family protein [Thermoanaerobaculia bacterium]
MARIVILTNGNYFATRVVEPLIAQRPNEIAAILRISGDYKGRTGFQSAAWLIRVTTLPYFIYKVISVLLFSFARKIWRGAPFVIADVAKQYGIPLLDFASIRSEEAIRAVEEARPDLIVSAACPQLIPKRVLESARFGGINTHGSLLPRTAGLAPYYWVLVDGDAETGTTIHYMTSKFDDGNILAVAHVPLAARDSAFNVFRKIAAATGEILPEAVALALAGEPGRPMPKEGHTYRSHPDWKSYRTLRRGGHRLARISELWSAVRDTVRARAE